jgi:hypothetical protein
MPSLSQIRKAAFGGLAALGLLAHAASPVPATTNAAPPPFPPSPVAQFRELLQQSERERARALSERPEPQRRHLEAKCREYLALTAIEREFRLQATELRWYLRPLLELAPSNRIDRLAQMPAGLRTVAEERLRQWDQLPPAARQEFLQEAWALRFFLRLEPRTPAERAAFSVPPSPITYESLERELVRWQNLSPERRQIVYAQFQQFFELSPVERERTLDDLPPAERQQIEATLRAFAQLAPAQRQLCLEALSKFTGLSPAQRAEFLRNADRWKEMPRPQREAWRRLVTQLPPLPPGFGEPPLPPGLPSSAGRSQSPNLAATNQP